MDDLISRQQAINVIERTRAYIGHNMERAVGAAFIEILDDVGKDIGRLPSAQPDIIYCKDCNHFYKDNLNQWCFLGKYGVKENGFCSRAERREVTE